MLAQERVLGFNRDRRQWKTWTEAPAAELAVAIRRVIAGERVVDPKLALAALSTGSNPLTVRERETMGVVTIIELLSPSNKRRGRDGRREYLEKRKQVQAIAK